MAKMLGSSALLLLAACWMMLASSRAARHELSEPSAYEELESFGFPAGLLPHTVVSYNLQSNGRFSLDLEKTCSAVLQGTYLVTYGAQISGVVSYGSIKHLKGISVRAFFIDFSITSIRVSKKDLVFEVGIASAKFPVSNFDESPQCEASASADS